MKKFLAATLTLALAMTMLTACAGGDKQAQGADEPAVQETASGEENQEKTDAAASGEQEASQDAAEDAEDAADAAVSEALADGVLTVGTNAEFPPFEYVDDNG